MSAPDHDPCCPIYELPVGDCVCCSAIAEARGQEKAAFNETWKVNLPLVFARAYQQGYADAAAHHPPAYP